MRNKKEHIMKLNEIENTKRPMKKDFLRMASAMSRNERMDIARELVHLVQVKLTSENSGYIPYGIKQEMRMLISQVVANKKHFSAKKLFKMYVVGCFPVQEIQHWNMTGSQCWRQKRVHKDNSSVGRTRRSSIRGWSGEVIPRAWLDKHLPDINTQAEYDRHMAKKLGYDKLVAEDKKSANPYFAFKGEYRKGLSV